MRFLLRLAILCVVITSPGPIHSQGLHAPAQVHSVR